MWVININGIAVNLNSSCSMAPVMDGSLDVYTVRAYQATNDADASESYWHLFRGTEAECRAYIAYLVDKMNTK